MAENEPPAAVHYQAGPADVTLAGLAAVGVKLMGLSALLLSIPHVTLLPSMFLMSGRTPTEVRLSYALPAAAYVAAGVVLLFGAEWVVARVLRVPRGGLPPTAADERLQAVAFSLLGVLLMMWGAAELARAVGNYLLERAFADQGLPLAAPDYGRLVESTIELLGGVTLFFGGRGLAALWHRMRYGGVRVRTAE